MEGKNGSMVDPYSRGAARHVESTAMLGLSRQSTNKELRALQDAGLIVLDSYSRIKVPDIQALQAFASSDFA